VSDLALWRVEPLAVPPLAAACPHCRACDRFDSAGRFRVNANQARLDVWLLYRCARCDHTLKRRLHRRIPVGALAPDRLEGYFRDDPDLARAHAFEVPLAGALPYRVVREPVDPARGLAARIAQPLPCGLRWDRFLAGELGISRGHVARAWRAGALAIEPAPRSLAAEVRDGEVIRWPGTGSTNQLSPPAGSSVSHA
jgi:hypothetical protein